MLLFVTGSKYAHYEVSCELTSHLNFLKGSLLSANQHHSCNIAAPQIPHFQNLNELTTLFDSFDCGMTLSDLVKLTVNSENICALLHIFEDL